MKCRLVMLCRDSWGKIIDINHTTASIGIPHYVCLIKNLAFVTRGRTSIYCDIARECPTAPLNSNPLPTDVVLAVTPGLDYDSGITSDVADPKGGLILRLEQHCLIVYDVLFGEGQRHLVRRVILLLLDATVIASSYLPRLLQ